MIGHGVRVEGVGRGASSPTAAHRWRRSRLLVAASAAVVLVVVASGCVVNGTWTQIGSGATARAPFRCITDEACVGFGPGRGLSVWDGASWTNHPGPSLDLDDYFMDIDCLAVDRCMAFLNRADMRYDYTVSIVTWDGTTWTDVPGLEPTRWNADPPAVSCGTDGCVAKDTNDTMVLWDGEQVVDVRWALNYGFVMDCVTMTDCLQVGSASAEHWDGEAWTSVEDDGLMENAFVNRLSCGATTTRCVAGGSEAGSPVTFALDGGTWTKVALPDGDGDYIRDLSCATSLECVAIMTSSTPWPPTSSTVLTFVGNRWFAAPTPPGGPNAVYSTVACADRSCIAHADVLGAPDQPLTARYAWTYP